MQQTGLQFRREGAGARRPGSVCSYWRSPQLTLDALERRNSIWPCANSSTQTSVEVVSTHNVYSWMPTRIGHAFLYAPITAVPLMWISALVWDRSVSGSDATAAWEWLAYAVLFGVPLNYATLVLFGIPATYILVKRRVSLGGFVLIGATAGALASWVFPGWRLHEAWALIGALVGAWNAGVIWKAWLRAPGATI